MNKKCILKNKLLVLLLLVIGVSHTAFAQADVSGSGNKSAGKESLASIGRSIDEFVSSLIPEDEWKELIVEFGQIKGNYCGATNQDISFKKPCLSQLDCLCKEHSFGYTLKKYQHADRKFAEEVFSVPFKEHLNTSSYRRFLRLMVLTYLASKLAGENHYDLILAAHQMYKTNPRKAQKILEDLIDENRAFKKKIDEIKAEKKHQEEEQGRVLANTRKTMTISMQPFNLFLGSIAVSYEYLLAEWVTLRTHLSLYAAGLVTETYLGYANVKDFSIFAGIGAKMYPIGSALKLGLYVEPFLEVGYENVRPAGVKDPIREIGLVPSVLVGVDKVFASGITVDFGLGVGYHVPVHEFTKKPKDFNSMFVVPRFNLSVGYSW